MKKGQITLFVILGLIILILVSIVIFMSGERADQPPLEKVFQAQYSERLQPLANDISFCIGVLGQEAFEKLGAQSGYIYPFSTKLNLQPEHINDGLELFEGSGVILPYWYSIESSPRCSNCSMKFNVPPLTGDSPRSIASQVEKYVEDNILTCVNDFNDYEFDMDISSGVPEATVIFREESTFIGLDWPIDVVFGDGANASMNVYNDVLDLEFSRMYDLALDVLNQMELYGEDKVLESLTGEVISILSLGGKDAVIPPVEGPTITTFQAPKIWDLRESKQIIKEGLSENLNYLQIIGSRDSFISLNNDAYFDSIYSGFQRKLYTDDEFLSRTRIRFEYQPNWPLYLDVTPSFGHIAMPNSEFMSLIFFQMGMTRYRFSYDVTYPVVVVLEEPFAFDGKGYTFQFAYEVNIRNNNAYNNETIFLNESSFYEEGEEPVISGFGALDQRNIPVKIRVYNGYTLDPLEDFGVVYTCIDKTIVVGASELKEGEAVIDTLMPPCLGGYFSTLDIMYGFDPVYASILSEEGHEFEFLVYPEKNISVQPRKRLYGPGNNMIPTSIDFDREWRLNSVSQDAHVSPMQDEEVYIILTKVINGVPSDNYIKFIQVNYPDISSEIGITPGTYKIDLISTLELGDGKTRHNVTIPEVTYPDVGETLFNDGEDIVVPELVFNSSMYLGGLVLDDTLAPYLEVTSEDIQSGKSLLIFYPAINPDALFFVQDLEGLNEVQTALENHPGLYVPVFEE